ncbi:helix-turn-helix domain-containing protein [Streptomyces sp. NBC_00038]|uniref:helix-turn-helix domain-containing protein n=1 Tax=Streptomyces sp. NBC_00038 TaxID=2903615 RepID=UPI00224DF564|nr:helix-turn-helix domain-containing protein [Streptomyces sp. NBC_00038]MCX5559723.1 helix-turn-helix domain-containing protein [Streptomyces sp. NBC_00038]
MLLTELLAIPRLGLVPVGTAGTAGPLAPGAPRTPHIRGVYTTDLPDPGRYLDGGELVLTSTTWYREPRDADTFVAALAGAGAAALVAGTAGIGTLPDALAQACERHGLALFTVGDDVSYAALTETVLAALAGPARRSPGADLHRGLVASMASGAGPEGLVEVFARATGVWCAVLSATGRATAGGVPEVTGHHLDRAHREALAAGAFPSVQPVPGGGHLTFFPVQSPVARRPPAAYLAASGDFRDWAPGVADAASEVCALLAMDRVARQESRRIEERFLRESLTLVREGRTDAAEGRLRSLGLTPDTPLTCVYVTTTGSPYGAELAAVVLEDVFDRIPGCSTPVAEDDGYVMLVPGEVPTRLDDRTGDHSAERLDDHPQTAERLEDHPQTAERLEDHLQSAAAGLTPLLVHGWAALGIGGPATGAAGLRRSLDEARHAHRIACLGTGTVRTATGDDLSSYLMLLAAVPEDVRRLYRERLIGVVERYDAEHGSDLMGTLAAFLDASGSWHRCAEQLHVHVNTLRYRLQRVEQLTGHSLSTLRDRVDFCLALSIT